MLTYDPTHDKFSDGTHIDWFTYEDIESSYIFDDIRHQQITSAHLKAKVIWPTSWIKKNSKGVEVVTMGCPVTRYPRDIFEDYVHIDVPANSTVLGLLVAISEFYDREVTVQEALGHVDEWRDDIVKKICRKYLNDERITVFDLLGEKVTWPTDGPRRHAYKCTGLVRYEGISFNDEGHVELILGS